MYFEELFDGDVGINRGRFQVGVTEELLNETDVGPAFEHVGGATVAQLWRRRRQPPGRPMRACLRVWLTLRPRTSGLKGGGEEGGGEAERNRRGGNRRPPGRGACGGRRMRVITSLTSCWRGGCMP